MTNTAPRVGTEDLRLPDELREPLKAHLRELRQRYLRNGWGHPVGFGEHPALLVIDLALGWTTQQGMMGTNLDPVVEATCRLLEAARAAELPIFFSSGSIDPADPPRPGNKKIPSLVHSEAPAALMELDPRLQRKKSEKLILKHYASAFQATNFHNMLTNVGADTLIVTGCSTSHCVYATCRDARDRFNVIVPREAVGERCELMHEVFLLDIAIDLGDVLPTDDVVNYLQGINSSR